MSSDNVNNNHSNNSSFLKELTQKREVDLLDLLSTLTSKMHIIAIASFIGILIFLGISYFFITPKYQSTAKIYIVSSSKDSVVDISDLNIGTTLTKDYEVLILSYPVLDEVINKCNLDMDSKQLAKKISIVNPTDTRIINIIVTDTDPEMAAKIANTLANVSVQYLPKTMSTNAPNIAQKARVNKEQVSPSYVKYSLLGMIIGIVISTGFICFKYMIDDSIHDVEEMEYNFGIIPLTTIPDNQKDNTSNKSKKGIGKLWKK